MTFDVNNPANLLTLKTEVATDPIGMGYNPDASTTKLLKALNDGVLNVGGETVGAALTIELLLDAIMVNPGDLTVGGQFSEGKLAAIKMVLEASNSLFDDIERYRTQITEMFGTNGGLRLALEAQSRLQSRAEVLFGVGTIISKSDWFAARDS